MYEAPRGVLFEIFYIQYNECVLCSSGLPHEYAGWRSGCRGCGRIVGRRASAAGVFGAFAVPLAVAPPRADEMSLVPARPGRPMTCMDTFVDSL